MSYLVTTPDWVTAAAGDLASIGSSLQATTTAASALTTGIAAAAADEVSATVAHVFGSFGEEFKAVSAQASSYYADFVRLLGGSATAYLNAEIANAGMVLVNSPSAAAAVPGSAYGQLVANTATNLQALGSAWAADPFPLSRQFLANQADYAQQIATVITTLPSLLTNIQAAVQQASSFNGALFAQQFVATQTGFAQTFVTSAINGFNGLAIGLPNFASGLQVAAQTLLTGDYTGAVSEFGRAAFSLLVTGVDTGPVSTVVDLATLSFTATINPRILGPLGEFFTIMNIPGQEAQFFTNLIPPSIPRQMAQNFTNILNTLTVPSIRAEAGLAVLQQTGTLEAFFGLPLVATYAAAGAPLATLNAIAGSAQSFEQAMAAGNYLGAANTLFEAPAAALNGFLNGNVPIDTTINVPTGLDPNFLPANVAIVLHLPSDGFLVPPHPATATVNVPQAPLTPALSLPVTIFGTPFSGLIPLLVNYTPQQLAAAIKPAA
ncbi:PE family protein [Mycobacterium camsae]|uniref:PE family protein n=1 Tax=Mycobacterium gordonae TaxID=1778 RepID=UPI00197E9056|nr:PE family protein [Mycobacterium gordonae]